MAAQKRDLMASWEKFQQHQWNPDTGNYALVPDNEAPFASPDAIDGDTLSDSTFFSKKDGKWLEWRQLLNNREEPFWGVVVYNEKYLQHLETLLRLEISFRKAVDKKAETDARAAISIPLNSREKEPIGFLRISSFKYAQPQSAGPLFHLTAAALILVTVTITLLTYVWFVHPVNRLLKALETEKPDVLESDRGATGEMRKLTHLISESLNQKQRLRKEITRRDIAETELKKREVELTRLIDQRDRLNRDLHDEIIQSLFALGLHMESLRPVLNNAAQNKRGLTTLINCRNQVNDVIRKLRRYLEIPQGKIADDHDSLSVQINRTINSFGENHSFKVQVELSDSFETRLNSKLRQLVCKFK